jgi:ABC-type Fe3+/spermidine/putrescine transport system ATPase subunit
VTNPNTFIGIEGIEKKFGAITAVDSVDLGIDHGEFFSLLGPSGCGKTTLLRMIGGLEFPTRGRIVIDGADVTSLPAYRRPTNMVFQSYAIFPHLTVGENIAYGLRRSGLTALERQATVERMLELIRLPGFAGRKPNQLSGGQLQRVALARALILKPKVLLLDEPLAALDRKLRENMQIELRSLQKEVGITFVFVTHDQEEALTLSDRIAVMSSGRVLQCSTPRELYDVPQSRAVAEFVGEMNFLDGRIAEIGATRVIIDVAGFGHLPFCTPPARLAAGQAVALALRPERFIMGLEASGGMVCRVRNKAYFGNRSNYLVEAPGMSRLITVSYANDTAHAKAQVEIGDELRLLPDPFGTIILPNRP